MKTKKSPAKAEPKAVSIDGARLTRITRGDTSFAALIYEGDLPEKGASLRVKLDNGVTYAATVHDAAEVDGSIICELSDGLTPVAPK